MKCFMTMTSLSSVVPPFSLINKLNGSGRKPSTWVTGSSGSQLLRPRAVERESSSSSSEEENNNKYEVDTDKARQALEKLDQQLLSLSTKPLTSPKNRAKDLDRPQSLVREETPDFSGSFLPYSAFALLLFSIFYNVIFITVIKPYIDLPEQVEETTFVEKPPAVKPMPQSPLITEALNLRSFK